jgi:hypothetical protein
MDPKGFGLSSYAVPLSRVLPLYFKNTNVLDPKIRMYNVSISEGYPDNGKMSKTNPDASGLETNRVKTIGYNP